ncbi:MAG: hypothetical protein GXP62_07180 [Oligoflexia bacterium]|nr:hypothetical protein [Oligoflexia bacterium]
MKPLQPGPLGRLFWSALRRNRPTVPFGAGQGDDTLLRDSPALRHLAGAIAGGHDLSAGQLQRSKLSFISAPDPSAWLRATQQGNPSPAPDALPLRVLTWNLALLNVYLGSRHYKSSPFVSERREPVFDRVLGADADIILIQELWHAPEIARLRERATAAGYRLCCPPRHHVDGLAVLLREGPWAKEIQVELRPFATQARLEALDLPRKEQFLRCWMRVDCEHSGLGRISIFNTHLQAYPKAWRARLQQARSLGLEIARRPPEDLVFVGGDLNSGLFYGRQTWRKPDGTIDGCWWHNAISLPLLHHYGGLCDLAIRGRSTSQADLEVRLSRTLQNDPVAALKAPLCCSTEHRQTFTATDCNSLYHRQYAGTEQPARLDHILARDPTNRVCVVHSSHRFTDRDVVIDKQPVEPSDHYAVQVDLRVAPPA